MRPLRIAFLGLRALDGRWGGVERHVEAVAKRLAARQHDVTVFVRSAYSPAGLREVQGVRLVRRPTLRGKHAEAGLHSLFCSVEAAFRGFDVVHYHAKGPALFCWLPRLAGKGIVTTIHCEDDLEPKWGAIARAALRAGERSAARFGHRTIVVARHLQRALEARGRPAEHVANGVDLPPPAPPRAQLADLGLRGDDYLLFLGRWTRGKRVRELVEAFVAVAPPDVRLVVAGTGEDPYATEVRAAATPQVVFPGRVDGPLRRALLAHARAYVSLSGHEGQPIAVLEAMASGRACVCSDIPAHRELLEGGRGLLRPGSTAAERADAVREACALGGASRAALGEAALAHVRLAHDWDKIVDRIEAIYREIL